MKGAKLSRNGEKPQNNAKELTSSYVLSSYVPKPQKQVDETKPGRPKGISRLKTYFRQ